MGHSQTNTRMLVKAHHNNIQGDGLNWPDKTGPLYFGLS